MHTRCVARREHGEDISSPGPNRATPVPLFTPADGRARRAGRAYRIERGGQAIGYRAGSVSCRGDRQAGYAAGELHIRFEVQPADDGVQEHVGGTGQRGLTLWNCQRPNPALRFEGTRHVQLRRDGQVGDRNASRVGDQLTIARAVVTRRTERF